MTSQGQQNSFNFSTPELTHRLELILHLLEYSNHLVIVKGEHESGKSVLCSELAKQKETNLIISQLTAHAHISKSDIYATVISAEEKEEGKNYNQEDLNQWLTRCQNKQKIPALLIDNIDLLNDEQLSESFELVSTANAHGTLHLCLFCEPSFLERLEETGLGQDESQSLHIIEMPALTAKQTEHYIRAKYPADERKDLSLFYEKTIKQIHRISHGMPGRINALCAQYLDDPAQEKELKEEKLKKDYLAPLRKNKSVLIVVVLLAFLSIGITSLLHQEDKKPETQTTIKLNLTRQKKDETTSDIIAQREQAAVSEPEPITIDELSPPVISEIVNDVNDKTDIIVYNAEGEIVAQESELPAVVEQTVTEETTVAANVENTIETIPEPEPEPLAIAEVLTETTVKDINWLTQQDPKKYVLQLIGAYEQKTIDFYLKSFKKGDDKIIPFSASNNGREWHVLIYGLYVNRAEAVAAIEELPGKAKQMAPWPRTVGSIKDLLK